MKNGVNTAITKNYSISILRVVGMFSIVFCHFVKNFFFFSAAPGLVGLGLDEYDISADAHYAFPRQNVIILPAEKPEKFCFSRRYERYKPPLGLVKLRIAYIAESFTGMDVYDLLVSQFGKIAYHCRASHIKIPPYYSTAAYVCPIRLCS